MRVLIVGGGIAGLAVARALGLLDSIAALAMPIATQRILDSRGKPLSITRTEQLWSSCGPCMALPRADASHVSTGCNSNASRGTSCAGYLAVAVPSC